MIEEDGRVLGLTVALKHLLEKLEQKGILPFSEREQMLEGMYHEIEHIPDLQGDELTDATRTIGHLWNCAHLETEATGLKPPGLCPPEPPGVSHSRPTWRLGDRLK